MRRSWSFERLPRAAVAGPTPATQSDRSHQGIVWSVIGAGALAVVVLFRSEPFWYATLGQATPSDLPSLAALLAALACELSRPKRGVAPLVLLSLAGLWRPEPWLIAALYWVWVARGRPLSSKLGLGAIALSAPALWMVCDLAMTGN